MSQMQPVRGTHDLMGDSIRKYRYIFDQLNRLSQLYGFSEIKTPIFEFSHVFSRTLGDASDIVSKEMYTFTDKGGDSISLRPEGTASVVRSLISEGLAQNMPLKLFYEGPMFRYERPQKGRYRQFYQIGIELIGTDNTVADVEVISLAKNLLHTLGLDSLVNLEINSIGDKESRDMYRTELVRYYESKKSALSDDSQARLLTNPLRILDSKDRSDIEINKSAPKLPDYLNESSKSKFAAIRESLDRLGIHYSLNPKLVRGLDYYSHLVFEFKTQALGAQDAVLSGGRYDTLSETMGGPRAPAVGWAAGIERLSLLLNEVPVQVRPVSLIPLGEKAESFSVSLAHELRKKGFSVDMAYGGNMSNRMKKAVKNQSVAAIILGEDELNSKMLTVKLLDSGEQVKVAIADLEANLQKLYS